jgi:hypothetical protein
LFFAANLTARMWRPASFGWGTTRSVALSHIASPLIVATHTLPAPSSSTSQTKLAGSDAASAGSCLYTLKESPS